MNEAGFININLDDVDDGTDPIPAGLRLVRIKSAQKKHKEGSEYPYIDVRLNPLDVDEKFQKRQLFLTLSFHPQAMWNMKLFMKKARIPWTDDGFSLEDFLGKELFVTVNHKPDQNDPEAVRAEVNPPYVVA
jgi:hypothetical protein